MYQGPATSYPVYIVFPEGETGFIISTTPDRSWLEVHDVINGEGKFQGWIYNDPDYIDVVGDLDSAPVVNPPPTPTFPSTASQ